MVVMIRFTCGTCNERLSVPGKFAGRRGACPTCGAVNRVPAASEAPSVAAAPGRFERVASASSSTSALHTGGGAAVAEGRGHGHAHRTEPPAARVTVRETVWRSIDPPTVDRQPASPPSASPPPPAPPSAPAPPPPRQDESESIRTTAPPAWPDGAEPAPPATKAAPALPSAWPEEAPARPRRSFLAWLTREPAGDPDALVTLNQEWAVDRGGLPMPIKLALLVLAVLAFGATVWATIYGLLWLLVPMDPS